MIAVSTGGPRIQDENDKYTACYKAVDHWLNLLGLDNPNPYKDLWEWYGRWSQGDLPSYASRRTFIPEMYVATIETIEKSDEVQDQQEYTPTGWERVDRTVYEMKKRLVEAANEEQFQIPHSTFFTMMSSFVIYCSKEYCLFIFFRFLE